MVSRGDKLILVVDDESRMIRFVRMNLELEGFQVAEASTGMEALEKVRDELPELVVLAPAILVQSGEQLVDQRVSGADLARQHLFARPSPYVFGHGLRPHRFGHSTRQPSPRGE